MDRRTTGIIATVVAVLLCGCPGLVGLCLGATFAIVGMVPGAEIDVLGRNDPQAALTAGLVILCLSIIGIAIPIVVAVLALRRKPDAVVSYNEPLPPVS